MRRPVSISGKLIVVNDGFGETVLHREISVNVSTGVWSQALLQSHRAGLSADVPLLEIAMNVRFSSA